MYSSSRQVYTGSRKGFLTVVLKGTTSATLLLGIKQYSLQSLRHSDIFWPQVLLSTQYTEQILFPDHIKHEQRWRGLYRAEKSLRRVLQ